MAPRVLMLGWGFPPNVTGGLDTHVGEVFTGLREETDVHVELILPEEYAPEDQPGIEGVSTGGGDIITRIGRLSQRFAERASDFDIVHTHDWFGYGPGSRAKSNADVEWISSFHSLSADRNVDPPQREIETERRVVERSDYLIAVSELTAQQVKERYGGDCHVIYNGFSAPTFAGTDVKEALDIDGPMVFFVGRHTDQKGIAYLLYGFDKLRRDDVTLVLGGKGHQTPQLKRFAELLDIDDQTEFVGYIPEEDLGDYYAAADVFVSPSLSEPFGITITEALEASCQVVATRSGVTEILPEDAVVDVEVDSESIADGIEEALSRDELPTYERRTWSNVVADYAEVYRRVAEDD